MHAPQTIYARYQDLQRYVSWTTLDQERILAAAAVIEPHFQSLVDDFYTEIERHPAARRVIRGGPAQVERLKRTLLIWLRELFGGSYDAEYVARRWRVGLKHVEIELPQVYTVAALARLRNGMVQILASQWRGDEAALALVMQSLNKLVDLDLAMIGYSYETDHVERQRAAEKERLADVLHQEKELSSGLLAHAQAAVLILDRQGRVVRCNTFVQSLTTRWPNPVQDRDWFDLFLAPEDRPRLRAELLGASPMPTAGDGFDF